MAELTISLTITKTVAEATPTVYEQTKDWIQSNVKDKLPSDASLKVTYSIRE